MSFRERNNTSHTLCIALFSNIAKHNIQSNFLPAPHPHASTKALILQDPELHFVVGN